MSQRESLEVRMDDRLVGTLALTANHKVAFSYSCLLYTSDAADD